MWPILKEAKFQFNHHPHMIARIGLRSEARLLFPLYLILSSRIAPGREQKVDSLDSLSKKGGTDGDKDLFIVI